MALRGGYVVVDMTRLSGKEPFNGEFAGGRYAQTSNAADGVERWASEALNKGRLAHLGVEMDAIQKSIASLAAEALTARNIGRGDAEGKLVELGKSDAILSPSHHS